MNPVIVGSGSSGSWAIRGLQLSEATGIPTRPAGSLPGFDVVIAVKRAIRQVVKLPGQKLVWDIVDAWPQPVGNSWGRLESLLWLQTQLERYRPDLVIAATRQMADDVRASGYPSEAVVHHARPSSRFVAVRGNLQRVVYEGSVEHLGSWARVVADLGEEMGFTFLVNPENYSDADVIIGLRQPEGYPCRFWKSNVKQANAQACGIPFIGSPEAGYRETSSGHEIYVSDRPGLKAALAFLQPLKVRLRTAEAMLESAPRIEQVAEAYKNVISGV